MLVEETLDATLDANGQLQLSHPPRLPAGPVRVTIRPSAPAGAKRGLSDVLREIAAEQRASGFPGRSAAEIVSGLEAQADEDVQRDRKLDAARRTTGGP